MMRFSGCENLPRESKQKGVTDSKHSADNLSWMNSLSDDERNEIEELVEEMRNEEVTDEEKAHMIDSFEDLMGKQNDIVTCSCCGSREVDRKSGSSFCWVPLSSKEVQLVKMSDAETKELRSNLKKCIEIPIDSNWNKRKVHPYLVQSFYFDDGTDFDSKDPNASAYHLHREFVVKPDDSKEPIVPLCGNCLKCLKKDKLPKHSIANGTDYGNMQRLEHPLVDLNRAENVAIARVRQYQCIVKTKVTQTVTRHVMDSHCISFSHEGAEKAYDVLGLEEMNNPDTLCKSIQMVFVGPKGERDTMALAVFSSDKVFLRSFALAQWARVFSVCNKNYHHFKLSFATKKGAEHFVQECQNIMTLDTTIISEKEDIDFENNIGDDTANVRTAKDTDVTENSSCSESNSNEIASVTYSHVTDSLSSNVMDEKQAKSATLSAVSKMFKTSSKKCDIVLQAKRSKDPMNEFGDNQHIITMANPTLFLLGTLFGVDQAEQGSLNRLDRKHMLTQFTTRAAHDPNFIFSLFDQNQRHGNAQNLAAHIRTHRQAFDKFAELQESKEFQKDLDNALANPNSKVAKGVLGQVMSVVRASASKTRDSKSLPAPMLFSSCLVLCVRDF